MLTNLQKTLLALGVASLGSVVATPAFAVPLQAYASGSATITLMNGASSSVGAEIGSTAGASLGNSVDVIPNLSGPLNTNAALVSDLTVDAAAPTAVVGALTFTAAAASILNAYSSPGQLEQVVSIIRAGAGADGLD